MSDEDCKWTLQSVEDAIETMLEAAADHAGGKTYRSEERLYSAKREFRLRLAEAILLSPESLRVFVKENSRPD